MDAKELFVELKAKSDSLHKYLKTHPEEIEEIPSWMFTYSLKEGSSFYIQGAANSRHKLELATQIAKELSETSAEAFILLTIGVIKIAKNKQQEIEEAPQWVQ